VDSNTTMRWLALTAVWALAVGTMTSCERPRPVAEPSWQAESVSGGTDERSADGPAVPAAEFTATPTGDLTVGDSVEVCWNTTRVTTCTLSILHASGEGEFGEVTAGRGCRPVVVETHTLVELFCSGEGGDANALLELVARR
jgi:hypothetical protein